jgi:hypothetical protein
LIGCIGFAISNPHAAIRINLLAALLAALTIVAAGRFAQRVHLFAFLPLHLLTIVCCLSSAI